MTIQFAKEFINYGIIEGIYEPEDFRGLTDSELIQFVQHEENRADWIADQAKENTYETME